jgi:thioredoxin 1
MRSWCPPCKVLSPLLERIERKPSLIGAKELDLVTLQGENVPDLAEEYKVGIRCSHQVHDD